MAEIDFGGTRERVVTADEFTLDKAGEVLKKFRTRGVDHAHLLDFLPMYSPNSIFKSRLWSRHTWAFGQRMPASKKRADS